MTRGESIKITEALFRIAEVKEVIGQVEVWEHLGPDGLDYVRKLKRAMHLLADVITEDTASKE